MGFVEICVHIINVNELGVLCVYVSEREREKIRIFVRVERGRKEKGGAGEGHIEPRKPHPWAPQGFTCPLRSPDPWSKCSLLAADLSLGSHRRHHRRRRRRRRRSSLAELNLRVIDSWASRVPAHPRPAQPPPKGPGRRCADVRRVGGARIGQPRFRRPESGCPHRRVAGLLGGWLLCGSSTGTGIFSAFCLLQFSFPAQHNIWS